MQGLALLFILLLIGKYMSELNEIYILLESEYIKQKNKAVLHLNNCSFMSEAAKKKAIDLMSPEGALAYKDRGLYTEYLYLDDGQHLSPQLYENICMETRILENCMETSILGNSANGYAKNYCWVIGIYAACANHFWKTDKKISIDAFMSAIRLLSGFNSINIYRDLVKVERINRTKRKRISSKGGDAIAKLTKIFRMESIRLLDKHMSEGKFWKSRQEAADEIAEELWQFIESKINEGYKTQLTQDTLNEAVLRWAAKNSDLESVIDRAVKKERKK
ncbi:hypothetical protein I4598_11625 [Proteus mirabilis]|nr:hypothetical protein [Proteus mirabilis]CAG9426784.1 hypothetical protein NVI2019_NGLDDFDA_02688 [Providencia alcalifaciens]HEK0687134.1 hypothetical protein [Proteus mirabilis]HEK2017714.1 hypothetical protein [Proteus mirabilis]